MFIMEIQCSYCANKLSFSKGNLFNVLAQHNWRVFGINVENNSNYYICQKCRELKNMNLPLYTPPNLAKAMKDKFDNCKPNCKPNRRKKEQKETTKKNYASETADIISVKV